MVYRSTVTWTCSISSFPQTICMIHELLLICFCVFIYHAGNVAMGFLKQKGALGDPVTVCALRVWISTSLWFFFFLSPPYEQITTLLLYLHTRLQDALYMQMPVHNELKRTFLRASRTLTSSLFSALKFIEKRHCFFKISLAVISGSVHCWRVNRKRVEIDIRGPKTSGAYHQRTSCSAGGSSSSSSRANKFLNASFFSRHG